MASNLVPNASTAPIASESDLSPSEALSRPISLYQRRKASHKRSKRASSAPATAGSSSTRANDAVSGAEDELIPLPTLSEVRATRLRIASNFVNLPVHKLPLGLGQRIYQRGSEIRNFAHVAEQNREMRKSRPKGMEKASKVNAFQWKFTKPDPRVRNLKAQLVRFRTRNEEMERELRGQLRHEKKQLKTTIADMEKVEEAWEETKEELENLDREKDFVDLELKKAKGRLMKMEADTQALFMEAEAEKMALEDKLAEVVKEMAMLKRQVKEMTAANQSIAAEHQKAGKAKVKTPASPKVKVEESPVQVQVPRATATRSSKRKRGEPAEEIALPEQKRARK